MNNFFGTGFFIAAIVLTSWANDSSVSAQERAPDEYFVCRIVASFPDGSSNELSGFKVMGEEGVYTALHGVAQSASISVFFHDPKTRHIQMELEQVDFSRDVAYLVPSGDDSTPKGGLALRRWPPAEKIEATFVNQPVNLIGFPMNTKLKPAYTRLSMRPKLTYVRLTEILNDVARKELAPRRSPDTSTMVWHLEGNLLPGHSGGPILDIYGAIIGVANGGFDQGKVGWCWAIPFYEVDLKPAKDPAVAQQLAKLPNYRSQRNLFKVYDDLAATNSTNKPNSVVTVVQSDDGSPILALKNMPAEQLKNELERLKEIASALRRGENDPISAKGELERISQNRTYLSSGTPVELVSEPEALKAPVKPVTPDNGFEFAIGQLFSRIQLASDDGSSQEWYVPTISIRRYAGNTINVQNNQVVTIAGNNMGSVIVNPVRPLVEKTILNNDGSGTLVIKEDVDDLLHAIPEPSNHIGTCPRGTEVRVLPGTKELNPILKFKRVEILTGEFKGKIGWVSPNTIERVER